LIFIFCYKYSSKKIDKNLNIFKLNENKIEGLYDRKKR